MPRGPVTRELYFLWPYAPPGPASQQAPVFGDTALGPNTCRVTLRGQDPCVIAGIPHHERGSHCRRWLDEAEENASGGVNCRY
jgi:hypothetical protein